MHAKMTLWITACVAHAHLAYLYRNICDSADDARDAPLTARAVTCILSAQV
jgi:hypothetical protein